MYKLTVLYGNPADARAFDEYYRNVHIPIARRMRGLTGWDLTWVSDEEGTGPATASSVHLIVDLYACDRDAMAAILQSPEGIAARDDVANFATGGVTYLSGDVEPVATT